MLNPVKVERYLNMERKTERKRRLAWLDFIGTKSNIRYNWIEWKTAADAKIQFYRQYKDPHWYIISPFSVFSYIWAGLLTIAYISFFIFLPFRPTNIALGDSTTLNWSQLPVDLFFLIDVPVNFCTAVYDPSIRTLTFSPSRICRVYLNGYFFVDLISSLPYDAVVVYLKDYKKMIYLHNTIYLIYILYYFKLFRFKRFLTNIKKILFMVGLSDMVIELTCIALVWLFISYFLITTLYFFDCYKQRIVSILSGERLSMLSFIHNTTNFIFIISESLRELPRGTFLQKFGQLTIYFITTLVEPFIGAIVIVFYWSTRNSDIRYRAMVDEVKSYTQALRAPSEINKKTLEYFKMYYHRSMLMDDKKAMEFFSGHDQMLILSNMVANVTTKVELFRDLPPKLRLEMVKRLKCEILFTGYKLTIAGQIGSKLYIVSSGKILLFSTTYTKLSELGEGSSLGEYQLLANSPYPLTAICAEITTVYTLSRDDFNAVLLHLTEIYIELRDNIIERHMNLLLLIDKLKSSGH